MNKNWFIYEHHLVYKNDEEIYHPSAEEIYADIVSDDTNLKEVLSEIRFSNIGSPVFCELQTANTGFIKIEAFTKRNGKKMPIDVVNGIIIDHCIFNEEWFFLQGNIIEINDLMKSLEIFDFERLSLLQYIMILNYDTQNEYDLFKNNINVELLKNNQNTMEEIPKGLSTNLYNYQQKGYTWIKNMMDDCKGCILGDDMGLGKTIQIITYILSLINCRRKPILIIAPVSLLANWQREFQKFAPNIDVFIHHGSNRTGRSIEFANHDVTIMPYSTAVKDLIIIKKINWELLVLDEAQNIKNPSSERFLSIKQILRKKSIAVTGTPFENHILDIWSLVEFVIPGILGTMTDFKKNISDDLIGASKIEPILSSIMLRRRVSDVSIDLPDKIEITQPIEMSSIECSNYNSIRESIINSLSNESPHLSALQKLRMYCTHPFLIDSEDNKGNDAMISMKYQRLCETLEGIFEKNEKALIFTSYKKMFNILQIDLEKRYGIKVQTINGDTPVDNRQIIIDNFNNSLQSSVLILNPRAAGTGLNIIGANHVIHYNLEWNPSLEDQCTARAYRKGQKRKVFIHRFYYTNTVEQLINEKNSSKREIANKAVVGTIDVERDKMDIVKALGFIPTYK